MTLNVSKLKLFLSVLTITNKSAQSLPVVRIVILFLSIFVLVIMMAGPAGQLIPFFTSSQMEGLESTCADYRDFDQVLYCETTNDADLPQGSRFNCDRESSDFERFMQVQAYTQSKGCIEIGADECTCITDAYLHQMNLARDEIRSGNSGSGGGSTIDGIITGEIREEQSLAELISTRLNSIFHGTNEPLIGEDEERDFSLQIEAIYEPIQRGESPLLEQTVEHAGGWEFIEGVNQIAAELNTDPRFIISVMAFETGDRFGSCTRNPRSSATGLIQFMAATATSLGTTTNRLCEMSEIEQLQYVKLYFQRCSGCRNNLDTIEKVYTAVFSGRARSDLDTVLYESPSSQYEANRELDTVFGNSDGRITVYEAVTPVRLRYRRYFGEFVDRRNQINRFSSIDEIQSDLLRRYTNSDGSPMIIGTNSPLWDEVHPFVASSKDRILGLSRPGEHRKDMYSHVIISVHAASVYAEQQGYRLRVTSGNRWGISSSRNHAQLRGVPGNAIDFVIENNNGLAPNEIYAEATYQGYINGATEFGFGIGNSAGMHFGVSIDGRTRPAPNKPNGIMQWNYNDRGRQAANIFNQIVRDRSSQSTS